MRYLQQTILRSLLLHGTFYFEARKRTLLSKKHMGFACQIKNPEIELDY
jgi:hypothetical protein